MSPNLDEKYRQINKVLTEILKELKKISANLEKK